MFYNYFAQLCKQKGISLSKACEDLGMSRTAHMKWKKGGKPQSDNMEKMAEYFDVPISEFISMGKKEEATEISDLSKKDIEFIRWWKSLSEEKRQAILILSKQI